MSQTPDKTWEPPGPGLAVPLDDLWALLGGAPARSLLGEIDGGDAVAERLDAPRAFVTPGMQSEDPSRSVCDAFAREVLALKLRACEAACELLRGRAQPATLAADALVATLRAAPGSLAPARWDVRIELRDDDRAGGDDLPRALGLLFARALFHNDARSPSQAAELADEIAQQLVEAHGVTPGTTATTARAVLARSQVGDGATVVYDAALRARISTKGVPKDLWLDVATLVLRLLTDLPGFSYAAPLEDLPRDLATIARRLDVAAFGQAARREEIADVLRDAIARRGR